MAFGHVPADSLVARRVRTAAENENRGRLENSGRFIPFEIVAEIGCDHHRLLASKLGKKASTNLGAIQIEPDLSKTIAVTAAEREAIKNLLDLRSLENFAFTYALRHGAGGRVHVSGHLKAEATQTCVVTLNPVPAVIDVPIEIEFWPPAMISDLEKKTEDQSQEGLIDWPEAIDGEQMDLVV